MRNITIPVACLFVHLVVSANVYGGPIVPAGLGPGDSYYLVFVTRGMRNAASTVIDDYNGFVQAEAGLNPALTGTNADLSGVQWRAIGSTATVAARDNININFLADEAPIYLLDGITKIADGGLDLWDGTIDAPIDRTQFLGTYFDLVWTGTASSGVSHPHSLGVADRVVEGSAFLTHSAWIGAVVVSPPDKLDRFYAVSEKQTVPFSTAVPEPGSLALFGVGMASMVAFGWIQKRKSNAATV